MEENKIKKSREIDVIGIINKVLAEKKLLGLFLLVFAFLGVIVALNTPKSYTSNVVLAPELSGAGSMSQNISDLASMVGVDLNSSGASVDAIYPEIYPDVVSSTDFILQLFDAKVKTEDDSVKTYYQHLSQDNFTPFWDYPLVWIGKLFPSKPAENIKKAGIDSFHLTKQQNGICNGIRGSITCQVDKKTSVITISVRDNDKVVSAIMADTIQSLLKKYITMYRTKKARNDLAYTQKLFEETKLQYIQAQQRYGSYADANEDVILESFKAKRDEMENEMQLRYNMYNQVAQQLQMAKAKVQERTPVFTVIQSASIPLQASTTPRSFIVLGYLIFGILLDTLWVTFLRSYIQKYRHSK
jgi:uncharacterized protein involved in exopolysaccharide biosynthesis